MKIQQIQAVKTPDFKLSTHRKGDDKKTKVQRQGKAYIQELLGSSVVLCLSSNLEDIRAKKRGNKSNWRDKQGNPMRCAYGSCSRCACQAFEGNDYVCENCGHSYSAHW